MKKLRISVPKGSALDSYLVDAGFIYNKIVSLSNKTSYEMNISLPLNLIDLLVSKFCLKDFSVRCHHDVAIFRVYS